MTILRLILGDQLSESISSLHGHDPAQDHILICEVWDETTYVRHHKKKIAFLFAAMRHFAQELEQHGHNVTYVKLDDPDNTGSFTGEVERFIKTHPVERIVVTHPGEYRVLECLKQWHAELGIPVEIRPDDRFLCSPEEFAAWAKNRQQLRMEYFYRAMRKKYAILMEGDQPINGRWNYDADNRKPPPKELTIPAPYRPAISNITRDVLALVGEKYADHFGDLEPFYFAVIRRQARHALDLFIKHKLASFGDYQDAMLEGEPWMYHAQISFYLNCGLLLPRECVQAAEEAYHQGAAPLNAVEGFIRQIIGWREYVRGIYWLKMPGYAQENFLNARRPLPTFYWTAKTKMNCLRQCVLETRKNAYAHHIQRLMVLGNFALLAGIDPAQVNEWFLIVYADAYEWVELPNVSGMILFADGGILASKPYAAGGGYINKMSDYCQKCRYDIKQKSGPDACPFHYLYWDFLARNRDQLQSNPRIGMMYKTYDRMDEEKKTMITEESRRFLDSLT